MSGTKALVPQRLVFLALVSVTAYGFYSHPLFQQEVWTSLGLRRLFLFALAYAATAAAIYFRRPAWLVPLIWGFVIFYTSGVVGFAAPAAVVLILFSSYVLGRAIPQLDDDWLAVLAGLCIFIALVGIAVYFRINYRSVYLLLLALPLLSRWKDAATCARRAAGLFRPMVLESGWDYASLALLIFLLLAQWLVALKPETSADGLAMHLAIPASVAAHHLWDFDFHTLMWAVMPMGGDWAYTLAYLPGGEFAARLLNLSVFALTAALLFSIVRRFASRRLSLLMTAAFASCPLVQLETGSLFIDNVWSATLLGAFAAVCRFRDRGRPLDLGLAAVFLGSAMSVKLGTLAYLAPLGCLALFECIRLARRKGLRPATAALCVLIFLIFALPPYVNAWVRTGNPVFPFLNAVFRSPFYFSSSNWQEYRFHEPLRWNTLFNMTFASHDYFEGQHGGFAFQFLPLLPLCILFPRRQWPYAAWAALLISLASFVLTFRAQAYLRYIYPLLPLATIPIALYVARMEDRWLSRGLYGATVAATLLNIYFLAASGWYHKDFYLNSLFGQGEVDRYLEKSCPFRRLIDYLNLTAPDAPVAFFSGNAIAGLRGKAYTNSWHSGAFQLRLLDASSPAGILQLAHGLHIEYFIAPSTTNIWDKMPPVQSAFLAEFTEPQYTYGYYSVSRLKTAVR